MKVGLYFGTFNPIHAGHLIIASHMAEFTALEQVWLVVTPHNPHKEKHTLLDDYKRLEMVFMATEDYPKLKPSDIEFKLPQPNYTVHTLAHLQEKYPQHDFALIMGEDNLGSLHKWKNHEAILEHHDVYVYPRVKSVGAPAHIASHPRIRLTDAPVVEISSTFIRESIRAGKNVRALLPEKIWAYVDRDNLYKK